MADQFNMDITSANAEAVLSADEIFPNGITLQQFSTDQSFAPESQQLAETRMGVDGFLAAGQTPNIKVVTISLEASSPSYESLRNLAMAMETNRKVYRCTLVVRIPSIGMVYTWSIGVLQNATWIPAGKKVLDPTQWTFHFQKLEVSTV